MVSFFQHLEDDHFQYILYSVDLHGVVNEPICCENLNTFTFVTLTVGPFSLTTKASLSSILDNTSTSAVETGRSYYEYKVLFGSGFIAGPVGNGYFDYK